MSEKRQGELAEIKFQLKATENGYTVSTPIGDNAQYDVVIEKENRIYRIQVKSTDQFYQSKDGGSFEVSARKGFKKTSYERNDFDVLAVYIVSHDCFYLIPVLELSTTKIRVYPHRDNPKGFYERFKERWNL